MGEATRQEASRDRLFFAVFLVLTLSNLVPLWSVRVPPMQDAWQHLALVDVLHHYDAPGSVYPDYFVLPTSPRPNLVYYYLTHLVAYVTPSLEAANKVVLSLYLLAFPASFLWLLRAFGRPHWLALFAFPLTYNAFFFYGFVSFLIGIPVLFAGLAAYRLFVSGPWREQLRHGLWAAAFMVLAFFTHAHIYLLFGLLAGVLWLLHPGSREDRVFRLAPFLPGLVFFVPWFLVFFVEQTPSLSGKAFGSVFDFFGPKYYSPSYVLSTFYRFVGDHFRDDLDDMLFLLWTGVVFVLLVFRRAPGSPEGQPRLAALDLEVLTLVLGVSVLALPEHIESQSIVSLRHVFFVVVFFIGWLGFREAPRKVACGALVALVALQAATVANLVRGFRAFDRELDGFLSLFERAEGGKRLLRVTHNQESGVVPYGAHWHTQFFYSILKGGIADMQFAEYPHNPIQYRPGMVPPKPPTEFWKSQSWRYFDYILIRKSAAPNLAPVADRLERIAHVSDWALYRVVEEPLPRPPDRNANPSPRRPGADKDWSALRSRPEARPQVLPPRAVLPSVRKLLAPSVRPALIRFPR